MSLNTKYWFIKYFNKKHFYKGDWIRLTHLLNSSSKACSFTSLEYLYLFHIILLEKIGHVMQDIIYSLLIIQTLLWLLLLSYLSLYWSLSFLLFSVIFVLTFSTAKAMLAGKGIARQVFLCVFTSEFLFLD